MLMKIAVVLLAVVGLSQAYDYNQVLGNSILFYEAQRTGHLVNNRIDFRGDSFTSDSDSGHDLSGGYFDAGDHVKFGLPLGTAMTILAWGLVDYQDGYGSQLQAGRDGVKWGTDWMIKAHVSTDEIYGQVGQGGPDHSYWGRPEDWPASNPRPAYKLTTSSPGSDLAGVWAAALAATSIVFKNVDSSYSQTCLTHARQIYNFGNSHRGIYSNSISDAAGFYGSSSYVDDLAYAAAWIARASGSASDITEAKARYDEANIDSIEKDRFDWDNTHVGSAAVLAHATGEQRFKDTVGKYCERIKNHPRTPKGLLFIDVWGSLRHAANAAFVCLQAADLGQNTDANRAFAKQQIDYMLGDSGRSYVVGYGNNPPTHCHHRAASCPDRPATCDWNSYNSGSSNPQVLTGALVGGPDSNDNYDDSRSNFQMNEVAIDYSAGFTAALAGLSKLY